MACLPPVVAVVGLTHKIRLGLRVKVARAGYSVLFNTGSNRSTRVANAHQAGGWRRS
jgi:hypothetical protein